MASCPAYLVESDPAGVKRTAMRLAGAAQLRASGNSASKVYHSTSLKLSNMADWVILQKNQELFLLPASSPQI
jgi:hypothetical protein